MKEVVKMTYKQKIDKARKQGIEIPDIILERKYIAGVYKFCYYNPNDSDDEGCFYVGKSSSLAYRLLDSDGGHIHLFLNNYLDNNLVPTKIREYLDNGYCIKVIIKEVNYNDTSFSRAAHRLALAELQEIISCQEKGQCLDQMPEGVGEKEKNFGRRIIKNKLQIYR